MNNESLKQELEKLHAELKKTQPGDQAQREQLQRLIKDVQASLDNPGEYDSVLQTSLTTRLTESIEMFEISHPVLTEQMDKLLEILSSAGI
jgi:chaperonin cofactor prefoldin